MCLIAWGVGTTREYPFLLFANRDMFVERARDSLPLLTTSDFVLCSLDKKSSGTWIGVNIKKRQFCGITNIGGRGGNCGSRGSLVMDLLRFNFNSSIVREKLEKKKEFPGFNLITSNINFRDGTCSSANKMFYLSNCDPENDDFRELESGEIYSLGNDLLGDDQVRAAPVADAIRSFVASQGDRIPPKKMRDSLAQIFDGGISNKVSIGAIVSKFFKWTKRRRRQPGLTSTLSLGLSLSLLSLFLSLLHSLFFPIFSLLDFSSLPTLLLIVWGFSLFLGFIHHLLMQSPNIRIPTGSDASTWATVSQTCILIDRQNHLHYFFRDTSSGYFGEWEHAVSKLN